MWFSLFKKRKIKKKCQLLIFLHFHVSKSPGTNGYIPEV